MHKKIHIVFYLLACVFTFPFALPAQSKYVYTGQFNFGCNVFLHYSKAQKFPGLRVFTAFGASVARGDLFINYGPSLAIYTKSIGANLNPLVGDWQIDFGHSITGGITWGKPTSYTKFSRTIHTGDFYNLAHNRAGAFLLSTNFILNNHKRHQIVGAINATFDQVSINYYNDGPPFDILALGDAFDRYWTGGGGIILHNKKGYNTAELSFDQFTGYVPLLYELSGILGINVPLYDNPENKNTKYNFNTAAYQLRINTDKNFGVNIGVIGSLVDKKNKLWGIQDIIHMKLKQSLHPNNDGNRLIIGASYNNFNHVKL